MPAPPASARGARRCEGSRGVLAWECLQGESDRMSAKAARLWRARAPTRPLPYGRAGQGCKLLGASGGEGRGEGEGTFKNLRPSASLAPSPLPSPPRAPSECAAWSHFDRGGEGVAGRRL